MMEDKWHDDVSQENMSHIQTSPQSDHETNKET